MEPAESLPLTETGTMLKGFSRGRRTDTSLAAMLRCLQHAAYGCAALLPLAAVGEQFELPDSTRSVIVEQGPIESESGPGVPGTIPHTGSDALATDESPAGGDGSFGFGGMFCTGGGWGTAATCGPGTCGTGACGHGTGCGCGSCGDPPGLFQKLACLHDTSGACWVGRVDALLLWRNAPPDRLLVVTGDDTAASVLNANDLDSTLAAGPRVSLIRRDPCSGNAWEATYLRAANFRSQRTLPLSDEFPYALADPGIFDNNAAQPFDEGQVNLGSRLQSFEFNRLICKGRNIRWLAGFRWVEWQENFALADVNYENDVSDLYQTDTINDLYGGQIGADMTLLTMPWLRVDSVIKAGAYYNNAVQRSSYTTTEFDPLGETLSVRVGDSPASCGFIGEVGMTGVMPITSCLDFRFGYFALWLSGIAQPTQQLSGQQLVPSDDASGSLSTNGGVVVQGVTLGLEGRW